MKTVHKDQVTANPRITRKHVFPPRWECGECGADIRKVGAYDECRTQTTEYAVYDWATDTFAYSLEVGDNVSCEGYFCGGCDTLLDEDLAEEIVTRGR